MGPSLLVRFVIVIMMAIICDNNNDNEIRSSRRVYHVDNSSLQRQHTVLNTTQANATQSGLRESLAATATNCETLRSGHNKHQPECRRHGGR